MTQLRCPRDLQGRLTNIAVRRRRHRTMTPLRPHLGTIYLEHFCPWRDGSLARYREWRRLVWLSARWGAHARNIGVPRSHLMSVCRTTRSYTWAFLYGWVGL